MNVPAGLVLAVMLGLIAATAIVTYEVLSAVFDHDPEPARLIMPLPVIIRPMPMLTQHVQPSGLDATSDLIE